MTPDQLDELERLERVAFRAPWKYSRWCIECETCTSGEDEECVDPYCDGEETECVSIESPEEYPDGQVVAQLSGEGISVPGILDLADRNGELIVALRNAAPALIKAARERDELRGALDEWRLHFAAVNKDRIAHLAELTTLRARVAELTADLETQRELYGVAAKEREAAIARVAELEARLEKVGEHGAAAIRLASSAMGDNELFCDEAEAFDLALFTPPDDAAGKEGK